MPRKRRRRAKRRRRRQNGAKPRGTCDDEGLETSLRRRGARNVTATTRRSERHARFDSARSTHGLDDLKLRLGAVARQELHARDVEFDGRPRERVARGFRRVRGLEVRQRYVRYLPYMNHYVV